MIISPCFTIHGRDEVGRARMIIWSQGRWLRKTLSVDVYWWPSRRWTAWWFPTAGVLGNIRLGRAEMQVRWMKFRERAPMAGCAMSRR